MNGILEAFRKSLQAFLGIYRILLSVQNITIQLLIEIPAPLALFSSEIPNEIFFHCHLCPTKGITYIHSIFTFHILTGMFALLAFQYG